MNVLKALSKQLFGAKYEHIAKSLITCIILFLAIHTAGIETEIAPSILLLTATAFSMGVMWQTLNSSGNADRLTGLFMLPFRSREMTFSFVLAFTSYTLITKTFLVLALFFAVHEWSVPQIAMSLLCACNSCFTAAAWYTMTNEASLHRKKISASFHFMGWSNFRTYIPCAGNGGYWFHCFYKYSHFICKVNESRRLYFLPPDIGKTSNQTHERNRKHIFVFAALSANKQKLSFEYCRIMCDRWSHAIPIRAIRGSKCYAAGVCRSMPEYPNLYIAFL